jgi:hypothetical protein
MKPADSLNIFCLRGDGAWRLHAVREELPARLREVFDEHGEAFPVALDLDDLDRYLAGHDALVEKRFSVHGSVELTARGTAADVLVEWLVRALSPLPR